MSHAPHLKGVISDFVQIVPVAVSVNHLPADLQAQSRPSHRCHNARRTVERQIVLVENAQLPSPCPNVGDRWTSPDRAIKVLQAVSAGGQRQVRGTTREKPGRLCTETEITPATTVRCRQD